MPSTLTLGLPARFQTWLRTPAFEDEDTARLARLLNAITLTMLGISIIVALIVPLVSREPEIALPLIAVSWPILLGVQVLMRRRRVTLASWFFVTAFWLFFTILAYTLGGVSSVFLILHVITVILASLLMGGPAALIVAGLTVLTGGVLAYLDLPGLLPAPLLYFNPITNWLTYAASFAVIGALLFFAVRGLEEALGRARRNEQSLLEQNVVLDEQRLAVQASEERFRALFQGLPHPTYVWQKQQDDFRLIDFNDSAKKIMRGGINQFKGVTLQELYPADMQAIIHDIRSCLEQRVFKQRTVRYQVLSSSDVRDLVVSYVYVPSDMVMVHTEDITARKQTEAEREQLIDELEARNAELERFTYTVSHDLKTPLVTIKGYLGMLQKDASTDNQEQMTRDLEHIGNAADQMGRLLGELLELSRIGRLMNPPEAVDLSELAREAAALVEGHLAARSVMLTIEAAMPVVQGDRVRLLEVFQNLLENAVKFMDEQPHPRIEIGAAVREGEVVCFVRDNGIGIAPQYREKVFELFERLEAEGEGTGIGLALVKRIVEVHGGRIWVESEGIGTGSTFCFTLPPAEHPA